MKIEILFKNYSFKEQIANICVDNSILVNQQFDNRLNCVTYELQEYNLENAKILSTICDKYKELKIDCYISINDAAEYFNRSLYPEFNKFERNLRKLIFILAIKSNDGEIIHCADKLDKQAYDNPWQFNKLMNYLFNNGGPLKTIKKRDYDSEFIKQTVEVNINALPKSSLWSYFVKEKSYLTENYQKIVTFRNGVMHASNMNFKKFLEVKSAIEEANREVELLIVQYANQTTYLTTPIQKTLNKIFKDMINNG